MNSIVRTISETQAKHGYYPSKEKDWVLYEKIKCLTSNWHRNEVLYTKHKSSYGTLHLYALTWKSGTLVVPIKNSDPEEFKLKKFSSMIVAWGKEKPNCKNLCKYHLWNASEGLSDIRFVENIDIQAAITCDHTIANS